MAVLLGTALAVTLALAGGTRSLTEIKAPIFAAGAVLTGLAALVTLILRRVSVRVRAAVAIFPLAAAAYLAFIGLSFLWAEHPWIVKYVLARKGIGIVLALSAGVIAAGALSRRAVTVAYVIIGTAAALFSLYWHAVKTDSLNDVKVPLGNANLLGVSLLLPMIAGAAIAVSKWRERRVRAALTATAAVALQFTVFVLCRSLSAWIGLGVSVTVLAFLEVRRRVAFVGGAAVAAAIGCAVLLFSDVHDRFRGTLTYHLRREYWRRAVKMTFERPLVGWGAGNYFASNQPFGQETAQHDVALRTGGEARSVPLSEVIGDHLTAASHNEYLDNAAEGGIAGLLLYCLLVGSPLIVALSTLRRTAGSDKTVLSALVAAYSGFLVTNAFTQNMYFADFAPHFWILAGLLGFSALDVPKSEEGRSLRDLPARVVAIVLAAGAAGLGLWFLAIRPYLGLRDYEKGCAAYDDRDFTRAIGLFRRAADRAASEQPRIWALDLLGHTYVSAGEQYLQSAHIVFRCVNGMVEGYDHFGAAFGLERSGLYEQAVAEYEIHQRMRPADRRTQKRLEFCRVMTALESDVAAAAPAAHEYFAQYPDAVTERRVYFDALLAIEPPPLEELAFVAAGFENPPTNPLDKFLLGRHLLVKGEALSAVALMEDAYRSGYRGPGINRWRTEAYIALGRYAEAWKVLKEGRRVNPTCKNLKALDVRLTELLGSDYETLRQGD